MNYLRNNVVLKIASVIYQVFFISLTPVILAIAVCVILQVCSSDMDNSECNF